MMMMGSDKTPLRHQKLLMDQCFNFTARREKTLLIQCYRKFIFGKHLMTNVVKNF